MASRNTGFTLAELLIALAILGVIATFAIPKVLQAQMADKKRAVLKETLAAIDNANYQGWIRGEITKTNSTTYAFNHINAVRLCDTNASVQGCAPPSTEEPGLTTVRGAVLTNGAMIMFDDDRLVTDTDCAGEYLVDWNGAEGPNEAGEDQLGLEYNCNAKANDSWTGNRPGVLRFNGYSSLWPDYGPMYAELYSK